MTTPTPSAAVLLELAERWAEAGTIAAIGAARNDPWYKTSRSDLAHAANCFAVSDALCARAAALSTDEGAKG